MSFYIIVTTQPEESFMTNVSGIGHERPSRPNTKQITRYEGINMCSYKFSDKSGLLCDFLMVMIKP